MKNLYLTGFLGLLVISCKTYVISPQSFKDQFKRIDSLSTGTKTINNPMNGFTAISYEGNQLQAIMVQDKKGNQDMLSVSPSLETRVTLKNGKRYHFYFDTLILKNDTLSGGPSRFISGITRKIPFDSIQKIEIQDGGKKFEYQ